MRGLIVGALLCLAAFAASAEEVRLVMFNIERGLFPDADLATVIDIIEDDVGGADVWALGEVSSDDGNPLIAALGSYQAVKGTRGPDFVFILFNKDKFELLDSGEIFLTALSDGQRKPVFAKLKSKVSGVEFFVVSNHFIRGDNDDPRRLGEAKDLNKWAKTHSPAIALGDFNFDFDIDYTPEEVAEGKRQHSQAYPAMIENDVWAWVRPDRLIKTQCAPKFDSVLDFAFVAGAAKDWLRESVIIDIGCDDTADRPDHMPVELTITLQ